MRSWNFGSYNADIAEIIKRNGAKPVDIIYFDESLPASRITRVGERYPTLTTKISGSGKGSITSNIGPSCTGICPSQVLIGTQVQLSALPDPGSVFLGWEGLCSGTGNCFVTVNQSISVTAKFDSPQVDAALEVVANFLLDDSPVAQRNLTVSVSGPGTGRVVSTPSAIDCGANCAAAFDDTSTVQLAAVPDPDSRLAAWSGDCAGSSSPRNVIMNSNHIVAATFEKAPATTKKITVKTSGVGAGTVTVADGSISCGVICIASVTQGSTIELTATPTPGSTFVGWADGCTGTNPICRVAMNADSIVTANFTVSPIAQSPKLNKS